MSALVITIGILVLVGWTFDIQFLKNVLPGLANMKVNTALCLVALGSALWLSIENRTQRNHRYIVHGLAIFIFLVGFSTLTEYVVGWNLGIDQLLISDTGSPEKFSSPGRMAHGTALSFVLLSLALWLLNHSQRYVLMQIITMAALGIALLALIGYLYGVHGFYGVFIYSPMALHSAVALLFASIGILLTHPHKGLMAIITTNSSGGAVARHLLLAVILLPLLFGWLHLKGQTEGLYGTEFGLALFVMINICSFVVLVWWQASLLNQADSKRQQAEDQLIEYRDHLTQLVDQRTAELRAILDTTADAIINIDTKGLIIAFNATATRIFGYEANEVIGQNIKMLMPEPTASQHDDYIRRRERTHETKVIGVHREEFAKRRDGTVFPIQLAINEVFVNGRLMYTGLLRDVTEARRIQKERDHLYTQIETALAATQAYAQRLDALHQMSQQINTATSEEAIFDIASTFIGSILNTEQFMIAMIQPGAEELLVVATQGREEIVKLGDIIPMAGTLSGTVARTGQVINIGDMQAEVEKLHPNYSGAVRKALFNSILMVPLRVVQTSIGVVVTTSESFNAFTPQHETLLQHIASFLGIAIENTRRNQLHAELHTQTQQALAATQAYAQRLDLLNEMSKQINLATTEETIFEVAAEYIQQIVPNDLIVLLLTESDSVSLKVAIAKGDNLFMKPGQLVPIEGTIVGEVVRSRQAVNIGQQDDLIKNSHPDYLEAMQRVGLNSAVISPMLANQVVVGTVSVCSTEENAYTTQQEALLLHIASFLGIAILNIRRNQELQHTTLLAEEANRAKSDFLATMSHELRTPLNGILGYVQILHRDKDLTAKQKEGLDVIYRSGDYLLTLINDILDLSKIEAQQMQLNNAAFDLMEMLSAVCDLMHIRAELKELVFRFEQLTDLPHGVYADETRLRQILLNLLGNAVKFTEQGGIVFKVGYAENRIRFQIEDTGIGISEAALKVIFEPFKQVKSQGTSQEGTGLGLAICHQMILLMGGSLQVKSQVGTGSSFWFDLNLPAVENYMPLSPVPTQQINGYRGASQRILVVDDRVENRAILVNMLQPLGFEVKEASDGQECLEKFIQFQPHVILIDVRMPVMDGLEAMRQLRQMPGGQELVLIAISASAFEHDREASQQAGADDFLPKPFRLERLLELLRTYLKLEWLFEEVTEPIDTQADQPIVMPSEVELLLLLELAKRGDVRQLVKQSERLIRNGYAPFGTTILSLAQEFKIKEIRRFIREQQGEPNEH